MFKVNDKNTRTMLMLLKVSEKKSIMKFIFNDATF